VNLESDSVVIAMLCFDEKRGERKGPEENTTEINKFLVCALTSSGRELLLCVSESRVC